MNGQLPLKPRARPDVMFVLHPEADLAYVHFEHFPSVPFDAAATRMTRRNAWWLTEAALLAYWDEAQAKAHFEATGMTAEFIDEQDVQCFLSWTSSALLVAFRGTEADEWQDVLDDAFFALVPWSRFGTFVHGGFLAALNRIWPRLRSRLDDLSPGRTVWFTGHSLGAALATLAADRWPTTAGLCTIGSPRVGDRAFAMALDARFGDTSLRYVNDTDIVTQIPPKLPFPYKHIGRLRHIAPDGVIAPSAPNLADILLQAFGGSRPLLELMPLLDAGIVKNAPDAVLDHMPRGYTVDIWNDFVRSPD